MEGGHGELWTEGAAVSNQAAGGLSEMTREGGWRGWGGRSGVEDEAWCTGCFAVTADHSLHDARDAPRRCRAVPEELQDGLIMAQVHKRAEAEMRASLRGRYGTVCLSSRPSPRACLHSVGAGEPGALPTKTSTCTAPMLAPSASERERAAPTTWSVAVVGLIRAIIDIAQSSYCTSPPIPIP